MARTVSITTLLKNKVDLEARIVKARRNLPKWESELEEVEARLRTFNEPENLKTVQELAERKRKELQTLLGQLKALGVDPSDVVADSEDAFEDPDE
jgi:hypothetical protein